MSHSFDSTLLQRMGFKDPDRKTPAHDQACIDLATNPIAMLEALGIAGISPSVLLELPLQKGDGKYASTVGFIDAMIEWHTNDPGVRCKLPHYERPFVRCSSCFDTTYRVDRSALVEVKTKIDGIGDLLRQMNLYREYKREHKHRPVNSFVVWSLHPEDVQFSRLLASQGYLLVVGASLDSMSAAT